MIEAIFPGGGTSVGTRVGGNSKGNGVWSEGDCGRDSWEWAQLCHLARPPTVSSDPRKKVNGQFPLVRGK